MDTRRAHLDRDELDRDRLNWDKLAVPLIQLAIAVMQVITHFGVR